MKKAKESVVRISNAHFPLDIGKGHLKNNGEYLF